MADRCCVSVLYLSGDSGNRLSEKRMSKVKRDDNYGYLNFFKVDLSGLYKIQRRTTHDLVSRSYGLSTSDVLKGIKTWVDGRLFKETSPWGSMGKSGDDPVMCYCREIKEFSNGDFMVVLWKHDPSDTRGYRGLELGLDGNPTGNYVSNNSKSTGENVVWGHPCYYWIVPSEDLVVSIKFEDSKCDTDLMQKWITNCVRYRLKVPGYNSRQPGESETRIFFSKPDTPEEYNLIYKFSLSIKEFKTSEELLESICERTKHMLLRNEVVVSSNASEAELDGFLTAKKSLDKANVQIFDLMQGFLNRYFTKPEAEENNVRRVEIKLEATPSVEQLKELMAYSSDFTEDGWADVIFIDEDDVRTSIKKHRIVERIMLAKVIDAYTCDTLHGVLNSERDKYVRISRLNAVAAEADAANDELEGADMSKVAEAAESV